MPLYHVCAMPLRAGDCIAQVRDFPRIKLGCGGLHSAVRDFPRINKARRNPMRRVAFANPSDINARGFGVPCDKQGRNPI